MSRVWCLSRLPLGYNTLLFNPLQGGGGGGGGFLCLYVAGFASEHHTKHTGRKHICDVGTSTGSTGNQDSQVLERSFLFLIGGVC